MDFKKKVKNLLQKEGLKKFQKVLSPNSNHSENNLIPSHLQILPVSRDSESELRKLPSDPEVDEALLKSIDPLFFTSEGFDPSLFELQKLPETERIDREYIQTSRQRILKELTVVSKKVFQLILEKQSNYMGENLRVKEIEDELETALIVCNESRLNLYIAKQEFTIKSLRVLANYRKKQVAKKLLQSLRTINTLQKTQMRLKELLNEDDYPGAIQLLLECQEAAVTYKHFNCISELSAKLQDTLENAEEQLDLALSKACMHFDEKQYAKLQKAYQLLGKTQTCMDQLLMHYASAIHNKAFSVVHGFAELCRVNEQPVNLQRKQYQDLCSCLTSDIFIPCLVDLCKAMWKILLCYYKLVQWHNSQSANESPDDYYSIDHEYIEQKLTNGAFHIWQDIQTKIRTFLLAFDFTGFKIDEFMQILSIIYNLKEVGYEFCNSESESLQECIRQASLRYFHRYHCSKLEELRIFLENESWEICPVRSDFEVTKLHEFKFLQDGISVSNLSIDEPRKSKKSCFERFRNSGSPFDIRKEESEENIYESSDKETSSIQCNGDNSDVENSEEEMSDKENDDSSNVEDKPIITNTTLSILRLFGRYLHMMHLLKSIAYDVAICMSQLFEYYFFSVFIFFASEEGEVTIESIQNAHVRVALSRIRDNLIKKDNESYPVNGKVAHPIVSGLVDLKNEENLHGLGERIIASESAIFLANELEKLKDYVENHLPTGNWESIAQLLDQAVIVSVELRRSIYAPVSYKVVDYPSILGSMDKVNWEVRDLMSQHSTYVDVLLRSIQVFSMRIERVKERMNVPIGVHAIVWELIFKYCSRTFVEGFSNAKKCSNGGRGLMQLDFMQFFSKLEKISPVPLKNLPEREYVESYVKAYYMPDTIMEDWIQKHSEYSAKQLNSLINCALQGNKRSKQRLLSIVEEMEKIKR